MIAAAINTHALAKMAYSSVLAGVGVAVVFSIAILGVARSSEMRREHRTAAAVAYTALAAAGLLLAAAIVIYGLTLVAHKT
jgi:predicted membrane channel-forming protein YqfA (hemolysin III family)